ncbi:MAG: hypothetical protein H6698_02360 [Myxococcales bacterium]|nr:hypothetical protein [Myxococcales bacterium]MCB9533155.1 hypothetical protein [Myxococcales bacterium]
MHRIAVVVVAVVLAVPFGGTRVAFAETALVVVDATDGDARATSTDQLRSVIGERDPTLLPATELAALARARWAPSPDPDADRQLVARFAAIPTAQNLFFENRFEAAIAALGPAIDPLLSDPTTLAWHPDLAPAAFEGAITLARAHRALGDDAAADGVLRRALEAMWQAQPSPAFVPPEEIARIERVRALVPTREVSIDFDEPGPCTLIVNGFDRTLAAAGRVRLPAGPQLASIECRDRTSSPVLLDPDDARLAFDLTLDDALHVEPSRVTLRPRSGTTTTYRALALALSDALGLTVYVADFAGVGAGDSEVVELGRASSGTYRAVRAQLGGLDGMTRLRSAVAYLVTGDAAPGLALWLDGAWTAPAVAESRHRRAGVLAGAALAVASVAVAVAGEVRTSESLADIERCADDAPLGRCDPAVMPALRRDATGARAMANVGWASAAVAGVALVTAVARGRAPRVVATVAPVGVGPGMVVAAPLGRRR